MILKRAYRLDVVPGGFPLIIRCSGKDSSSSLELSLFASAGMLDIPAESTVMVQGRNALGNTFNDNCTLSFSRGMPVATVNLTKQIVEAVLG